MVKESLSKYLKNILIIYKDEKCECTEFIKKTLKEYKYKSKIKMRDNIVNSDFLKEQLIITIGGDGTALKVAQYIKNNSLLLVVKDNSLLSEGYLSRTSMKNFKDSFEKILKNKFKVRKLPRLEAYINGKLIDNYAINEISISRIKPYQTLMYDLNKNIERATGIIVSTPLGSTGWNLSAGGKKLNLNDKRIQFIIREPYRGRIYKVEKRKGFLKDNKEFKVKIITNGVLSFDSTNNDFNINNNDEIIIKKSNKTLNYIEF